MKIRSGKPAEVFSAAGKATTAPRPFVFVNMAMTADGKIATANRTISSFSSKRDLHHLYELRTTADAIMAGARTLDLNKVLLDPGSNRCKKMRLSNGRSEYSLRVIVSGSGSIDPGAAIFQHRFSPIIVLTTERGFENNIRKILHRVDEVLICGANEINFTAAMQWLRRKWGVRRLLCEGGGELNAALFRAGLVDELNLTVCPKIIGGRHAPTIAEGVPALSLSDATRLRLKSVKQIGPELFLVYRAKRTTRS